MATKLPFHKAEKEFEKCRAYDIRKVVEEENYSLSSCEYACRAMASIAGWAMSTKDAEAMADFLDDSGCELLVQLMTKYCECSEILTAHSCLAVASLAWSSRDLNDYLGEVDACETIVYAMSLYVGQAEVCEYGSLAVTALAKQNISNSYKLSQAGACEILAQIGNFGFNLRHERSLAVATNVCAAYAFLAEAQNAQRLLDAGVDGLLVELLRLHYHSEDFAGAAVRSIGALSSLNALHREELGRAGVCQHLLDALHCHQRVSMLCLDGCEAMMHLSLSPTNAEQLAKHGAVDLLVALLRHGPLLAMDLGAEVSLAALVHLCTYGATAWSSRQRLLALRAVDALQQAQFSAKSSYKAREHLQALGLLLDVAAGAGATTGSGDGSTRSMSSSYVNLLSVIHGSEMIGDTVPLTVEVRSVDPTPAPAATDEAETYGQYVEASTAVTSATPVSMPEYDSLKALTAQNGRRWSAFAASQQTTQHVGDKSPQRKMSENIRRLRQSLASSLGRREETESSSGLRSPSHHQQHHDQHQPPHALRHQYTDFGDDLAHGSAVVHEL